MGKTVGFKIENWTKLGSYWDYHGMSEYRVNYGQSHFSLTAWLNELLLGWARDFLSQTSLEWPLHWATSSLDQLFAVVTSSLSYCTSSLSCLLLGMFLLWATSLSQLFLLKARLLLLLLLLLARPLQCVYEPPAEVPRSARVTPSPKLSFSQLLHCI